jgi:hypothetical protein
VTSLTQPRFTEVPVSGTSAVMYFCGLFFDCGGFFFNFIRYNTISYVISAPFFPSIIAMAPVVIPGLASNEKAPCFIKPQR